MRRHLNNQSKDTNGSDLVVIRSPGPSERVWQALVLCWMKVAISTGILLIIKR